MFKLLKKQEGFTLLELLIVIVIIGILAVLIVPNLASGPQRARDGQRKSDLRNIKTALETYYNDKNSYPATTGDLTTGTSPYIKTVPTDPKGGAAYTYTPAGGPPATSYVLQATLENKGDKDIKSNTADTYEVTSAN
ncbi:MAG TPA: prepilin-type N-terminal cleavage/methylation domain-containing protein [Candidatus Saccharimonadales bacterium]|nr:prepilin-type N-terminal cleavage/methylation domain-containing protein [Candidatus Saccharimonadales bacterium]